MVRYFFDVYDGASTRDAEGQSLPDTASARAQTLQIVYQRARDPTMLSEHGGAVVVNVRDGTETPLLTLRLTYNVEMR